MSMVPLPSEFAEKVNSFNSDEDRMLFRLTDPSRFGRDQSHCTRSSAMNGSLNVQGIWLPRTVRR